MSQINLTLGAMEPAISVQLAGLLSVDDAKHFDLDADAITRCHLRGLVGEAETQRARKRLAKKVQAAVTAHLLVKR